MKDGLLFASEVITDKGAKGAAVADAKKGQDVSIRNIEGVIKLEPAKVMIGKVLNVRDGGSRSTDLAQSQRVSRYRLWRW